MREMWRLHESTYKSNSKCNIWFCISQTLQTLNHSSKFCKINYLIYPFFNFSLSSIGLTIRVHYFYLEFFKNITCILLLKSKNIFMHLNFFIHSLSQQSTYAPSSYVNGLHSTNRTKLHNSSPIRS